MQLLLPLSRYGSLRDHSRKAGSGAPQQPVWTTLSHGRHTDPWALFSGFLGSKSAVGWCSRCSSIFDLSFFKVMERTWLERVSSQCSHRAFVCSSTVGWKFSSASQQSSPTSWSSTLVYWRSPQKFPPAVPSLLTSLRFFHRYCSWDLKELFLQVHEELLTGLWVQFLHM